MSKKQIVLIKTPVLISLKDWENDETNFLGAEPDCKYYLDCKNGLYANADKFKIDNLIMSCHKCPIRKKHLVKQDDELNERTYLSTTMPQDDANYPDVKIVFPTGWHRNVFKRKR